ncbi:protein adenylyltransferase SelO family protein [Vibrio sp. TRT 2004]|uniref:protein adenylyltransferase SelO family protein n=1 Tax=Vibrio sp. TRT 2004 TaxID=3418506 RepID=UPI003CF0DCBB
MNEKSLKFNERFIFENECLPELSFAPFNTYKLKNTHVLWLNKSLLRKYQIDGTNEEIEQQIINNYSYVSYGYANSNRLIKSDTKLFRADRYGSRHEVCNGGSARCGYDGRFHVKGIGLTPLLSENMSKSHSNGKLFLDEAISEAIWGEVCHQHLPFGAIRTLAIIKTNVLEDFLYLEDTPKKPCALAIREFSIRPAHFERCTFFWPSSENIHLRDNDAQRVRECIKFLPISLNLSRTELSSEKELLHCCNEMVLRIAKQVAYSRVKGIPHGSLTSSNISVDGRFLDFGTMTAVPDFGNYIIANGVGAVWDDHLLIINWIKNFTLTLNQYSPFGGVLSKNSIRKLLDTFCNELDHQENLAILEELGVYDKCFKNLMIAKDIKRTLVSTQRMSIGDFNDKSFRRTIREIASSKGLEVHKVNFELRDFKYSTFNILNDKDLKISKYSKESVKNLISRYC